MSRSFHGGERGLRKSPSGGACGVATGGRSSTPGQALGFRAAGWGAPSLRVRPPRAGQLAFFRSPPPPNRDLRHSGNGDSVRVTLARASLSFPFLLSTFLDISQVLCVCPGTQQREHEANQGNLKYTRVVWCGNKWSRRSATYLYLKPVHLIYQTCDPLTTLGKGPVLLCYLGYGWLPEGGEQSFFGI